MTTFTDIDHHWMREALNAADLAEKSDEVPVGAVLVSSDNTLLATGYNQVIQLADPTAHAEIVAMRLAAKKLNNYRLTDTTLYVTLEPCAMCMGAMLHARIKRLVFATKDPKTGCAGSIYNLANTDAFNHQIIVEAGLFQAEASEKLRTFFKRKRR